MPAYSPTLGLSTTPPQAEATVAAAGSVLQAADAGHVHPRLASATLVTTDANGLAVAMFSRSFTVEPVVMLQAMNPTGGTVVTEPTTYVMGTGPTAGQYLGVNIRARRARALPVLDSVGGLLTAVITGINAITTALSGFDVFNQPASAVRVSVLVIMPSA